MRKVIVCGGRDFDDKDRVFHVLDRLHARHPRLTIIEGGAAGADRLARWWAITRAVDYLTVPADWKKHGRAAGPKRNAQRGNVGDEAGWCHSIQGRSRDW